MKYIISSLGAAVFPILLTIVGCVHAERNSEASRDRFPAESTNAATVPEVHKIPLQFRTGNTPGLLANVEINGRTFQFLVDTGSGAHVISQKLVKMFGFHETDEMRGSTPYGSVQMSHLGTIDVKIGNLKIQMEDTLSDKLPAPGGLEEAGILGVVSPPRFAVNSLVVLDISNSALYIVKPIPVNISAWLRSAYGDFDFDEVVRHDHPGEYREVVSAKAEPFGDLEMFLDSGATTTNIYSTRQFNPSNPLRIRIKNHECVTGVAQIHQIKGNEHRDQLFGMDCLRGKILVFPPDDQPSVWIGWPRSSSSTK